MKKNPAFFPQQINSKSLEERLKQAIQKKNEMEDNYRETNQKYWTILFIDVSATAEKVWDLGEEYANRIFASYQTRVRDILKIYKACFIEPGGGPQVVCCFESPADAIRASYAVLQAVRKWNLEQENNYEITPSIGAHLGYIVYHDGLIHQSNTNNMAKRIQTQALPGQIFTSSTLYESLYTNPLFEFIFVKTTQLKNIPEPQDIYEVKLLSKRENNSKDLLYHKPETADESSSESPSTFYWIFIYIDVCESTKKFWSFGDREASALIQEYQKVCHDAFKVCGCSFAKSCEGDQIVAAFDPGRADNAIMSAVKILQFLFRRNTRVPMQKQVRAAIGIHFGEFALRGGELIQTRDMRIGKEIQSQASADEILLSKQAVDMLSLDLHSFVDYYGTFEFSGVPGEYDVYNLKWFRVPIKIAPLNSPQGTLNKIKNPLR